MLDYKKAMNYVVPLALFMGITPILRLFIEEPIYAGYIIKTIITSAVLVYYWKQLKEIDFSFSNIRGYLVDFLIGVLIFAIWVGPELLFDSLPSWYFMGESTVFNPYLFATPVVLIVFRFIGAVAIAPIIEELFVRSFLIRFLIKDDFDKVKIGTYSLMSFIITVIFFGLGHYRWIVGLITGVILNLWLYRTKSISSCIVAHSAANFCLAIFVLATQSWQFW